MDKVIISAKSNIPEEKLYTEKAVSELKAENERLREENEKLNKQYCFSTILKINELEQENERLKARLRPLEDSYFNGLSSVEIAELAKKSIRITAENRKLEDALQEIRDMAKEQLQDVSDRCINTTPMYIVHKHIIDKINEVIGAEDE